MKVPVYHLEAGNRSFDPNVPEEINRHFVDHVADYNLVYTEHSRRNLLAEGLHPARTVLMGSPMKEVLDHYSEQTRRSDILTRLNLQPSRYVVASTHREENVDLPERLASVLNSLGAVARDCQVPVLLSTHPRTRNRIAEHSIDVDKDVRLHPPMGFHDYVHLQRHALCVVSDSGTISEESSILGFPAVTLRDAIERPEALDTGSIITTGLNPDDVVDAVRMTIAQHTVEGPASLPEEYSITDSSRRVVNFIRSTAATHAARSGVRTPGQY